MTLIPYTQDVMGWAWSILATPTQKLVLLALAERADNGGLCCPSLTHLATATGLSRSSVVRSLDQLEEAQFIERERGHTGKSTRYRLRVDREAAAAVMEHA